MPRAGPQSPWRIDDSDRCHQILEIGERFAHSHEHDVVDLFAALALNRDDLIDNLVRRQIATESFKAARAKFTAVSAPDLRRNTDRSPIRARSIKRWRRRNQDRLNQAAVRQSKQEFASRVARAEHAHDVDLAKSEFLTEPISEFARQVAHLVERLDALWVEPVRDLPGP